METWDLLEGAGKSSGVEVAVLALSVVPGSVQGAVHNWSVGRGAKPARVPLPNDLIKILNLKKSPSVFPRPEVWLRYFERL